MPIFVEAIAVSPFEFPIDIPGDSYIPSDTSSLIPSVYANTPVDFDIIFGYEEEVEAPGGELETITAPIVSVELVSSMPFTGTTVAYPSIDTVNISGNTTGKFNDEVFEFLFYDKSRQILPPDNQEPWLSIIRWSKPADNEDTAVYQVQVSWGSVTTANGTIVAGEGIIAVSQYVYWYYVPSLNMFDQLVDESAERLNNIKTDSEITRYPNP